MLLLLLMMVNKYELIKWLFQLEVMCSKISSHRVIIVIMPIFSFNRRDLVVLSKTIQNHAEIYLIVLSAALHFQHNKICRDTYPNFTFILHCFMDLLLVSSKITLNTCFQITYPARVLCFFMNRLMFGNCLFNYFTYFLAISCTIDQFTNQRVPLLHCSHLTFLIWIPKISW